MEGLLEIDFGTAPRQALAARLPYREQDAVAVPAFLQTLRHDEGVKSIPGVPHVRRRNGRAQRLMLHKGPDQELRVAGPLPMPVAEVLQLTQAENRLHRRHAHVGSKALVQPTEARLLLPRLDGGSRFSVILEAPCGIPQPVVVNGQEPSLPARRDDLVLTERKDGDIAERTDRTALVFGTVSLGTVLNQPQIVLLSQFGDGIHVAGPAGEMHNDNRLGPRGQLGGDRVGGQVLAIGVDVGEYGCSSRQWHCRGRGHEAPRRDDYLVTRSNAENAKRQIEGEGSVRQRDAMLPPKVPLICPLEITHVRARPGVDLARPQDLHDIGDLVFVIVRPADQAIHSFVRTGEPSGLHALPLRNLPQQHNGSSLHVAWKGHRLSQWNVHAASRAAATYRLAWRPTFATRKSQWRRTG